MKKLWIPLLCILCAVLLATKAEMRDGWRKWHASNSPPFLLLEPQADQTRHLHYDNPSRPAKKWEPFCQRNNDYGLTVCTARDGPCLWSTDCWNGNCEEIQGNCPIPQRFIEWFEEHSR